MSRRGRDAEVLWTGPVSGLAAGTLTRVAAHGRRVPLCLANVDGRVFAFEDVCPHRGGRLSLGRLDGTVVRCPLHRWRFDVQTGTCLGPGTRRLTSYPVRYGNGALTVYAVPPGRRWLLGLAALLRPRRSRRGSRSPTGAGAPCRDLREGGSGSPPDSGMG
jgi:nitrite reductase/ring-hydroxylating ferredoxin subunit